MNDEGRPDAGAFELRTDKASGALKEEQLSVDWLDYLVQPLGAKSFGVQLEVLRSYRFNSKLPVFEKNPNAWFLVLSVGRVEQEGSLPELRLECLADPRHEHSACQCDEGGMTGIGACPTPEQALLDAHACIAPYPTDGPTEFAVMVHLRDLVEHAERHGPWRGS